MLDLAALTPHAVDGLVVHEWGTFTQVSGDDGVAVDWKPLAGPKELPGFVYDGANGGVRGIGELVPGEPPWSSGGGKSGTRGTVRMETPVIYFYSNREMEASVRVEFPGGKITEWYPAAKDVSHGIDWGRFMIVPKLNAPLLREERGSHYYAARETDAAPLRVCGAKTEYEKFLFYRGVGTFALPLEAKLDGRSVRLRGPGGRALGRVIVFERHGGKLAWRAVDVPAGGVTVERPAGGTLAGLEQELGAVLLDHGLFVKEARAMLATWRDDWFEDGLRVFYILPSESTSAALPLHIEPAPAELVRVMVGRAEIITPEAEQAVLDTLGELRGLSHYDYDAIARRLQARYGRFAEPIFKRLEERARSSDEREQLDLLARALAYGDHAR
ncbi:MAG TPA: hypothetical protein VFF06_09045 [Polyangia bacterium]|nr:hypothetical protein [Polyangia bacterium]